MKPQSIGAQLARTLVPLLLLVCAPPLVAQDPPPVPVPVRVDTTAVRDTLAVSDTIPPTARRLVSFPSFANPRAASVATGEWVWDREALLRELPVTLIDLLERIPAVATFRGGMFAQPEAAAAFGGSAGRVEVILDGYALDPLAGSTLDLAQLPLGQLREVRVQRRLGLLRILLLTDQPAANQPYTRIEAGLGVPAANLFRTQFLVPYAVVGPLGLAMERLTTDGTGGDEPADVFNGWAKWSWTNGRRGVQLEIVRTTLRRHAASPWPVERGRQDIVIRARNEFAPGLMAEVYAGRVSLEETVRAVSPDTVDLSVDRESMQAGVRAGYSVPWGTFGATFRYRDAVPLARTEAIVEADVQLGPARVAGEFGRATWEGGTSTTYSSLQGVVRAPLGASAFAELTSGKRGAPRWSDSTVITSERSGWRAGLSLVVGRASGSLAYVSLEQDAARPFGLPFDSAGRNVPTNPAAGIEAHGRFVIIPGWLAIESWITDWQDAAGWTYLPVRSWRTALEVHASPLPSGNLEFLARGEAAQRSAWLSHQPPPEDPDAVTPVPPFTVFNGYLQIRVLDVRAFMRWEDLLGANVESVPGRVQRGPRIFYGVKWNLWN